MKRFLIKFISVFSLILIPAGYYRLFVTDNCSGDIGRLGMIPFGTENDGLRVNGYVRDTTRDARVIEIEDADSLRVFPIITIGDSFSQFGNEGYQLPLSSRLGVPVVNFKHPAHYDVTDRYLALLNSGYLQEGQTVVLESVERNLIKRFCSIDTLITYEPERDSLPARQAASPTEPFLYRYLSWIRLRLGYKNPVFTFELGKVCFTQKRYADRLYVYSCEPVGDGDLLWAGHSEEQRDKAAQMMTRILELSEARGIRLFILVAADKYDTYEPWITNSHLKNPTLDYLPEDSRIIDTRDCLREAIGNGVMDVYKVNDTHWSVIGADIVADKMVESLTSLRLFPLSDSL